MRLIMIIVFGSILIGATYAWSSTLNHDNADAQDIAEQQFYKRNPPLPASKTIVKTQTTVIATAPQSSTNQETVSAAASPASASNEATPIDSAKKKARASAGKPDPFAPIEATMPFPRGSALSTQAIKSTTAKKVAPLEMVPPPPTGAGVNSNDFAGMPGPHNGFAPPPPPGHTGYSTGLSISDMPLPPEKPGVAKLLKLSAIIGDKAIFQAKDLYTRRMQKWPGQITLAPGDSFGTLKLISTKPESALVEEHGETIEMDLPPVR